MVKSVNITKIKGSPYFYAVLDVPRDVRGIIDKTSFRKSLKTSDKRKALVLAHPLVSQWKEKITEARRPAPKTLSDKLKNIQIELDKINTEMKGPQLSDSEHEALQNHAEILADTWLELSTKAKGVQHIEQLSAYEEESLSKTYKVVTGATPLFIEHLEQHIKELLLDTKSIDAKRRQILDYSEAWPLLEDATRTKIRTYTRLLSKDRNLSNKTIRKYLSNLSVYWEFLRDEAQVVTPDTGNPFKGQSLPKENSKVAASSNRKPFSIDDILKLETAYREACNNNDQSKREDYEIFLVAIYTGARREEIGELKISNINSNDMTLQIEDAKTEAGNRAVPIHPNLEPIIQQKLSASKDDTSYLFHTLTSNQYGKRTDAFGKRFGRIKNSLGFDNRFVFHSIRKTVITLLEQAEVPESVTADIAGHEKQTLTYGLYSGGSSLAQKADAIKLMDYELPERPDDFGKKV
jgi:integrase